MSKMQILQDISTLVNRLPILNDTNKQIYETLVKLVHSGSSSINDTIEKLKEVEIPR
jgi:hypothetical protein